MQPLKKNITVLVLILLLVIPILFSVVNIVKQQILQNTNTERFRTETLQTITIAKENLRWAKKGKEVIIDGKYFDVKSFTTAGDNILLTGFYDHHEDKLVKYIKTLMQKKNGSESPVNQSAIKFFFFPIFTQQPDINFEQHWKLTANIFSPYTENIPESYIPPFSPPPEL